MGRCLIGALVILASASSSADELPTGDGRVVEWGIYQIYWGQRYEEMLGRALTKPASPPHYVMFYRDLPRPFPEVGVSVIRKAGAVPIISLELWSWHDGATKHLPKINAGEFDARFREWAKSAKRAGGRILLRFGFEFNGDWFSWGGDPDGFVAAWRRAHDIFRDEGATKVEWVWSANVTSHPTGPDNSMHRYYPGAAYVDWVAVDGYNWGDGYKPWHRWQSFEKVFDGVLSDFARRYPDKPVMVSETGSPEGETGAKADWVREAFAFLRRHPQVRAVIWFNLDKRREGELDFRIDTSADALRAFNETFAAPRN